MILRRPHIIRELMAQQYIVIAPEYRGSTGYGKDFYEKTAYGRLEHDDLNASRDYIVRNYEIVDSTRVGIIVWSNGGMIALMCVFDHLDKNLDPPRKLKSIPDIGYSGQK